MPGQRRVTAVYTANALVEACREAFAERLPDVDLVNVVDDQLIFDINRRGEIDTELEARTLALFDAADHSGADLVFCTCSSIGEVADQAAERGRTRLVKIDQAMVEQAAQTGGRVGVLATLASTLDPTVRFIERVARETGADLTVVRGLAEGAFEAAVSGDRQTHDDRIVAAAERLQREGVDLFVLAQGSMARIEGRLKEATGRPVLSSLRSGVDRVAQLLG